MRRSALSLNRRSPAGQADDGPDGSVGFIIDFLDAQSFSLKAFKKDFSITNRLGYGRKPRH